MRRNNAAQSVHDLEAEISTALHAWNLSGRPAPSADGADRVERYLATREDDSSIDSASWVAYHLDRTPPDWTPPADWHATHDGEPDVAETLRAYIVATEDAEQEYA